MSSKRICIATITLARTDAEAAVLKSSLAQLVALGLPVVITDGGSVESFKHYLRQLPKATVIESAGGVWPQAKSSLLAAKAQGVDHILYTEPDKEDFFRSGLSAWLSTATTAGVGVHLAARSAAAFASFPRFQQQTETAINQCCAEAIGPLVDYTYGPFLLQAGLVDSLHGVPETIGWGWRPYAFAQAKLLGLQVTATEGAFFCPPAQRTDNAAERIYRMQQLEQNIRGLLLGLRGQQ